MKAQLSIALRLFLVLTVLTGLAYPLCVTGLAQLFFAHQANGSLIYDNAGNPVGSELIGQSFENRSSCFQSRPSAGQYGVLPSSASNLSVTSARLKTDVAMRREAFLVANGLTSDTQVPSEMLFSSASGLDPHISPEAARMQVDRVALARKLSPEDKERLRRLVEEKICSRQLGILGVPVVNVQLLNRETDRIFQGSAP